MQLSLCLLSCALALAQTGDRADWQLAPQLAQGMELVYRGTYSEETLIPNVQHQRQYRLETILFVLGGSTKQWDVAFLTALSLRTPNQDKKPGEKEKGPTSVRLELGTVETFGRLHGVAGATLAIPVAGPPTIECGMLLEVPLTKVGKHSMWEVNEEGRPPRTWKVAGLEACNGITCIKLEGEQQSEDWDRPRADRYAWRRRDTLWLIPQLGLPQKVERLIERRAPAHREPTQQLVVRYELESRLKFPGRLFEERREEIAHARKFHEEAKPLLLAPVQYAQQIEALQRRLTFFLQHQPATPYRKAVTHLQNRLEAARRGEFAAEADDDVLPRPGVAVGQRVPEFVATDLISRDTIRLSRHHGRPVLVFFFNPATESGKEVLDFALQLHSKHGNKLAFMPMAVNARPELVRQQHERLQLPFPILDGQGLHLTFGVEATPRLVVLDGDGIVRSAHTGWGYHVPREIGEELARCLKTPPAP